MHVLGRLSTSEGSTATRALRMTGYNFSCRAGGRNSTRSLTFAVLGDNIFGHQLAAIMTPMSDKCEKEAGILRRRDCRISAISLQPFISPIVPKKRRYSFSREVFLIGVSSCQIQAFRAKKVFQLPSLLSLMPAECVRNKSAWAENMRSNRLRFDPYSRNSFMRWAMVSGFSYAFRHIGSKLEIRTTIGIALLEKIARGAIT